jgi:adenylate cyclase
MVRKDGLRPKRSGNFRRLAAGLLRLALWGSPIVAGLALATSGGAPVDRLRNIIFDEYQRLAPRQWSPDLPVRIVDIDDESLARYGQWPWPHSRLAELTDKLAAAGAAAIVFDVVFSEEDRLSTRNLLQQLPDLPERDALAAAIAKQGPIADDPLAVAFAHAPVVAAVALAFDEKAQAPQMKSGFVTLGDDPRPALNTFPVAITPLAPLAAAAQGLGAITYVPDGDLLVRKVPLVFSVGPPNATQFVPSIAAEALRVASRADTIVVKSTNASGEKSFTADTAVVAVEIGEFAIPTDRDSSVRLRYAGLQKGRYIPAWSVLAGEASDQIAGRIVLIGTSATALGDIRSTPLNAAVPGVDIHAELLENILSGEHLTRPDFAPGVENVALVLGGLLVTLIARRSPPLTSALAAGIIVLGAGFASWAAFRWGNLLVDPLMPGLTWIACFAVTTVAVYRASERERYAVRHAFSRYLAPAIVERLAADPSQLRLGGEQRMATILFSDVRDFTARAESLSAEGVVDFLNALHTPLTRAVLEQGGTIDKYIGDGLMAFWNAPLEVTDHASRACRAALDMVAQVPAIDRSMAARATEENRPHAELRIGIGINTGEVFVGNMGSQQRFDYSIVGDPVNVAARLEAATKEFGLPILVSDATARAAPGFRFVDLGEVDLKGRSVGTHIYALHDVDAEDPSFAEFLRLHGAALATHTGGTGPAALRAAVARAAAHPLGAHYARFYARLVEKAPTQIDTDYSPGGS